VAGETDTRGEGQGGHASQVILKCHIFSFGLFLAQFKATVLASSTFGWK